jgi:hypothetical protein
MTVGFLTSLSVSLRFTAYPKYPPEWSFLLFGGRQIYFPWSNVMTCVYRRCLENVECFLTNSLSSPPTTHIPWCFGPPAHRQLYSRSTFCHRAVWCTASAVGLWSFPSTLYTWNYEFKQISSPRIRMLKFDEYVTRFLLFKYVDHRLECFSLSLQRF